MATHSSILAWRIPWTARPGYFCKEVKSGKQSGGKEPDMTVTAAAAATSLKSCPTLCDPIEGSPPGSSTHGILQARLSD